jgi:hypothetical protein
MKNLTFSVLCMFLAGNVSPAQAQSEEELRAQRFQAHQMMVAGYPMQAATDLLSTIRLFPADDPTLMDRAAGTIQLLLFDINLLMTEALREEFFTKILDIEHNEIDAFLITLHDAHRDRTPEETGEFLRSLWEYTQSTNDLIASVALYLLADPYYSKGTEAEMEASRQMVLRYPNLEATRNMLLLPIYDRRDRPAMAGEWIRAYRGKLQAPGKARDREATDAEMFLAAEDTLMSKLEPLIDDLSHYESKHRGVDGLIALIEDEDEDWRDRYSYVRMLEPEMKAPPGGAGAQGYWKRIKPTMEVLANRGELTPDVFRARVMLCNVAGAAGEFEDAAYWAERVLTEQDRLYEHPEHIMWESAIITYANFAKNLANHLRFEDAAQAYERLADRYPNSNLEIRARKLASEVRAKAKEAEKAD